MSMLANQVARTLRPRPVIARPLLARHRWMRLAVFGAAITLLLVLAPFPVSAKPPTRDAVAPLVRTAPYDGAFVDADSCTGDGVGVSIGGGPVTISVGSGRCDPPGDANKTTGALEAFLNPSPGPGSSETETITLELLARFVQFEPLEFITFQFDLNVHDAIGFLDDDRPLNQAIIFLQLEADLSDCECGAFEYSELLETHGGDDFVSFQDTVVPFQMHLGLYDEELPEPREILARIRLVAEVDATNDAKTSANEQSYLYLNSTLDRITATPYAKGWDRRPPSPQAAENRNQTFGLGPPYGNDGSSSFTSCQTGACDLRRDFDFETGAFHLAAGAKDAILLDSAAQAQRRFRMPTVELPAFTELRLDVRMRIESATTFAQSGEGQAAAFANFNLFLHHTACGFSCPAKGSGWIVHQAVACEPCIDVPDSRSGEDAVFTFIARHEYGKRSPPGQLELGVWLTARAQLSSSGLVDTIGIAEGEASVDLQGVFTGLEITLVP